MPAYISNCNNTPSSVNKKVIFFYRGIEYRYLFFDEIKSDIRLSETEQRIIAFVYALCQNTGQSIVTNKFLSGAFSIHERNVRKCICKSEKLGWLINEKGSNSRVLKPGINNPFYRESYVDQNIHKIKKGHHVNNHEKCKNLVNKCQQKTPPLVIEENINTTTKNKHAKTDSSKNKEKLENKFAESVFVLAKNAASKINGEISCYGDRKNDEITKNNPPRSPFHTNQTFQTNTSANAAEFNFHCFSRFFLNKPSISYEQRKYANYLAKYELKEFHVNKWHVKFSAPHAVNYVLACVFLGFREKEILSAYYETLSDFNLSANSRNLKFHSGSTTLYALKNLLEKSKLTLQERWKRNREEGFGKGFHEKMAYQQRALWKMEQLEALEKEVQWEISQHVQFLEASSG